ncbi:hypothetical protein [Micromonospora sp. NPDC047074]|uniref:hypothetical protein n=1 Tax=Micromonospora sp. NPDC047074 TaxID=3154339 RepID=UPI0033E36FA0
MKWYHFVIAGLVACCLLCSCAGGAFLLFRDRLGGDGPGGDRPGLGLGSDPAAGCHEAIRGSSGSGEPRDVAHLREAAAKANHSDVRSAILDHAAALEKFTAVKAEYEAKKSAGTQDTNDVLALNRALRDRTSAYSQLLKVCTQAGYR